MCEIGRMKRGDDGREVGFALNDSRQLRSIKIRANRRIEWAVELSATTVATRPIANI